MTQAVRNLPVSLVVAAALNGTIGRDGDMPWRLSTDLRRFKTLTLGCPIVMGRRTFDAIGRALPGRHTIVATRDGDWEARGVERADSPEDALARAFAWGEANGAAEVCVVGGGEIYRALRPKADLIRLTLVEAEIEGDTRFDRPDDRNWREISRAAVRAGPEDTHPTRYGLFVRR